ncbi:type I secretion system permease/ATPase [Methylorubrum extorquens]|jgi:ATP-binding cassette subfamily C protein|uniref:Type I secretion system ATPase n=3 Tax=Methylorubrum extorquens TaxID=408 RepID=C5AWK7_METEA|nr:MULTISPECIES: type I secretion system permease/ATPase [Methylorubrum]KQQ05027.1 type I secretion system ABC transporter ATP-binding protein [Methylobacterium sp. Leaf121]ACS38835.1 type I secretion system ATPase [Methylorubrum extorquens AM1]MCP1543080.1 ATP-binding cassette subfamily C protein [Methylorubrum extorquens]MCP1589575.1 ATP-binding cassette subfamily C protein [Methylorubrum extorquens]SOR31563.1 type I secretion system ATPase [Methylorubrum extorquens]
MSDRVAESVLKDGLRAIRPVLMTVFVFAFFTNLLLFAGPLYMLQVYDRVLSSRNEATLLGITGIAAFALAVYAVLEMLRSRLLVRGGMIFDRKVAGPVFEIVHRAALLKPRAGHETILRDVDVLREFLTGGAILALCDLPWASLFLMACFILHPWFGWMALLGGGTLLGLTLLTDLTTRRPLDVASQAAREAGEQARATMRGGEVLRAMGMLGALRSRWRRRHDEAIRLQARASDRAGLITAATKFTRMFLQTMVLGVGAYLAIHGEISAGSMIAASIIMGRTLAPIEAVVGHWKSFTAARRSYARLADIVGRIGLEPQRVMLPRPRGLIETENLVVAAPGSPTAILHDVSVRLEPGSVVGIIGPSAAGKSTLVRAITGVWPITSGAVRIDGADLRHWDPQALGRHLGYLPQDVELFDGTVAQNIARFDTQDDAAIVSVAQRAGCHDLIQALPDGYNTRIGSGGHGLSGGQRQRIALARAMYGDPSLVVLDEPNASLDQAGEAALMRAVADLRERGTTVVIVTHKVSLLAGADQILMLEGGTLRASGPADQILTQVSGPRPVPALVATGGRAMPENERLSEIQRSAG